MIEINKKEDILIPFNTIGEPDWEVKTRIIIESLAENWDNELTEAIPEIEINQLEARLGTDLPEGLKLFYMTFGVADINEQLQNFAEIDWIQNIWKAAPQYGPDFTDADQEYLPYLISFSDSSGNGNMFCFHSETKEIYYFDHDSRPYLTKMFDRVDEYFKSALIFAQTDLFGDLDQQEVSKWTEEIVSNIVGKEIVKKWMY